MLGGFLRRGVSISDRGDHLPPLASPFKQTTPLGSGSRPPFPPRRPLRRERRAATPPSNPTPIASTSTRSASPKVSPGHSTPPYPSSSLLMRPETPVNNIPPSSSPPPAPKRSRIRRSTRHVINDTLHDLSIVIPPLEYPSPDLSEEIQGQPVNTKISSLLDAAFRRSADRIQTELIHMRNLCAKVMTNRLAQRERASSVPVHTTVGNYPASPTSLDFEDSIMAEAETETEVDSLVESSDNVSTYSSARSSPSTVYHSLPASRSPSPHSVVEDLPTDPSNDYSPALPLDPLLPRALPMRDTPTLSPITFREDSTLLLPLESSQAGSPCTLGSKRKRSDHSSDDYSLPHRKRWRARSPSPSSSIADENEVDQILRAVTPGPEPTRTSTDLGARRDFDASVLLAPRSYAPFDQVGPSRVYDSVFLLD